jgi:hypothetical protein|tara:strand:+ start:993 stop:1268 length:276 start_codon:yes stop_codon:yes gene_type:complete
MRKRTRSILEELSSFRAPTDNDALVQTAGNNLIESSINLLNRIAETYDAETASDLERRFINSIRSGDPRKFKRGVDRVVESRTKKDTSNDS